MQIHIEASALPGRSSAPDSDFAGFANSHVG
ncbi:monooxygenase, partial [Streptomyces anulatus]